VEFINFEKIGGEMQYASLACMYLRLLAKHGMSKRIHLQK